MQLINQRQTNYYLLDLHVFILHCKQPLKEYLLSSKLEESNEPFAIVKLLTSNYVKL